MNTKLTLSIDQETIGRAKIFARERHTSLSNLVEGYLKAVTVDEPDAGAVTPLVAELSGVLTAGDVQTPGKDYTAYLVEKFR